MTLQKLNSADPRNKSGDEHQHPRDKPVDDLMRKLKLQYQHHQGLLQWWPPPEDAARRKDTEE